jgi:hypothetical protein
MTTVFLSGSRSISRLNHQIRQRIGNMIDNRLNIIVGDAKGADKAMQNHLFDVGYADVTVYCVGETCRNNVGNWRTQKLAAPKELSGRDFYALKDKEMARIADCGLVLWDAKSSGSVANMLALLNEGKKVVVYFSPNNSFYTLRTQDEFVALLGNCDDEALSDIDRKVSLPAPLGRHTPSKHETLSLF